MKTLISNLLSILVLSIGITHTAIQAQPQQRIVMVLSGYGQADEKAPGYEFDEFSKAYLLFKAHGVAVDIASPAGGKAVADNYDPSTLYNQAVLNDAKVTAQLANTFAIATLDANRYQGIFIVGGKGAMFDLPHNNALQQLIAKVYQQQGVIAAVCHGPAALVNVKLDNGSYLVAGKKVNAMTNIEEKLFAKKWLQQFEFMLEDKLIERGGHFQSSPMMLSHVAVDQRLITGQNPASTVAVAQAFINALGIKLLPTPDYKDDRTLGMIAGYLAGDLTIPKKLADSPQLYQLELVGAYGFYFLDIAVDKEALLQALVLMQLGEQQINHPKLTLAIAQTQHKLGDTTAARTTLQRLLAKNPEFEEAEVFFKTL